MISISITNNKGGVGKTTSAINIGDAYLRMGKRVLFIDFDAQRSLSYEIVGDVEEPGDVVKALKGELGIKKAITHTEHGDILTSSPALAYMDDFFAEFEHLFVLQDLLATIRTDYDICIIDLPPSMGKQTVSALLASNYALIPIHTDIFSAQGLTQVCDVIKTVQRRSNPNLRILGVLITCHDARKVMNRQMADELYRSAETLGLHVFATKIRETIAVRESQACQQSVIEYAPKSTAAQDYLSLVDEMEARYGKA